MAKRRTFVESFENMKRVMNSETPKVVGAIDITMAAAYDEDVRNQEQVDKVQDVLKNKAEEVVTEREKPTVVVDNIFTSKLVLDESIDDFSSQSLIDGRSSKTYEDEEDPYINYDMFDFIYGLVTDSWPKPLNPLNHRLRKFLYIGSDKYKENPNSTETSDGHAQVATSGDSIEVYSSDIEAFNDIIEICKLYRFKYDGPTEKRSKSSHWTYSFRIHVPLSGPGYPEMVEDYFNKIGKKLEDVMPSDFCKQYRKRLAKLNEPANIEIILHNAILKAAQDKEPLESHLNQLYADLDAAKVTYSKTKIRKRFLDAFDDSDLEE